MQSEFRPFEPARERRAPLQSSPLRLRLLVAALLAMPLGTPLLHVTAGTPPLKQPLFLAAAVVWLAVFVTAYLSAPPSSAAARKARKEG